MGFKTGHKKIGGREKGQPNKKSLLVSEILENNGINLVEKILFQLPQLEPNQQTQALVAMLPYVYPKLTAMELSGAVEGITIRVHDYTEKK